MSRSRHTWVPVLVGLALVSAATASCGGGGREGRHREKPAVDPMYAVSDGVRFTSDGEQRGDWRWLAAAGQTARWAFSGLPDELTDLVTQLRVAVPDDADKAEFYVTLGTTAPNGADRRLGVAKAVIPAREPIPGEPRLALASITIPRAAIPRDATSVWLRAGRADPTGRHPTLSGEVAFQKGSVRFSPLRLPPSDQPPVPDETTTREPGVLVGPSKGGVRAPPPPPTTPPTQSGSTFTSNGDFVDGWWWLRDQAGSDQGEWTFPMPSTGTIRLDLEVLATSSIDGPPGARARFWVSWGPVVGGITGTDGHSRLVVLQNTSASGDPVGYTNTGSLTLGHLARGTQRVWVRIARVDLQGAHLGAVHVRCARQACGCTAAVGAPRRPRPRRPRRTRPRRAPPPSPL